MARQQPINAVFLDDNQDDLERYAGLLRQPGVLAVEPVLFSGSEKDVQSIIDRRPDLVLIDYRLVEGEFKGSAKPGLGTTVGALVREDLPQCPIVLVTRGTLFNTVRREFQGAYDEILIKDRVSGSPEHYGRYLVSLVEGFRVLERAGPLNWKTLCRTLGATPREADELRQANLPALSADSTGVPLVLAAKWIRETLIEFPGILYDPLHSASALGISVESFGFPDMQSFFAQAKYSGPFAPYEGRWWKYRLTALSFEVLEGAGLPSTTTKQFGVAWNTLHQADLTLSRCVSSGEQPAECVCFVLKQPVKRQYSLPYWPDSRPQVMDEARVSFKAIIESNDFDEELVAPDCRSLVPEIQRRAAGQ